MSEEPTLQERFDQSALEAIEAAVGSGSHSDIVDRLARAFTSTVQDVGSLVLQETLASLPESLELKRSESAAFVQRNFQRWSPALDLLECLVEVCEEAGSELNKRYRPVAVEQSDYVFEVVVRLHARACQIARESVCLIVGGYADGAHARWRAVHEVACTALFVQKHGNEAALRFLRHEVVESHKARLQYNQFSDRTGLEPFSDAEVAAGKEEYDSVVAEYGVSYKGAYGWAAEALGYNNPNFSDIEKNVQLDHMRPYYKWASQNVHAGSKGVGRRLGVSSNSREVLLTGPSDHGVTDPADAVGLSLLVATVALMNVDPTLDDQVAVYVAAEIQSRIGPEFVRIDPYHTNGSGTTEERP